jgi:hypothetical protein
MGVSRPHKKRLDYWVNESPAKENHCVDYWRLYKKYHNEDTKNFVCIRCLDVYYDIPAPYKYGTRRKMCDVCSNEVYNKNIPKNQDVVLIKEYDKTDK